MNYSNIKNCNQRQFNATMNREHITVSDYYDSSKTYDVFFRRSRRGNNPQGKVRLYFSQDTPIQIGTTFVLKDTPYVVTSRDGDESDIFYTSMAMKCDTTFTVKVDNKYVSVPFVTLSDKFTLSSNSTISMISGAVVIYTGDNLYSREVEVNESYYNYGGYYKVGNRFFNNGLAYVYMTREAMPTDRYSLTYNGATSLDMKDATTYQLSFTAIKNDAFVSDPALTYASSDDSIATVDGNGLMTMLKKGNVTITTTWTDGNNTTCTIDIAISNSNVITPTVTVAISYNGDLDTGFSRTYTAIYTDVDGNNISSNYNSVWTITDNSFDISNLTLDTSTQNKCKIKCANNEDLIGLTFKLNVVDSGNTVTPVNTTVTIIDRV